VTNEVRVVARSSIADGVLRLVLRNTDGTALPKWTPGAHIDLQVREGLVRQYSLCGDLDEANTWTVAILRESAGRGGSAFMHDEVRVGAKLSVHGLRNHFPLTEEVNDYIFIAGGIGITPLIPMMQLADRRGDRWQLFYGGRNLESMAFGQELADKYGDRVNLVPQDKRGLLDLDHILSTPQPGKAVYCCGPYGLLDEVDRRCKSWPEGSLHIERFEAANLCDLSGKPFTVKLRKSGRSFAVGDEQTILQVLRDHGYDLPSACEEGICGTCETTVLSGFPDHRDFVLSSEERTANHSMMICVSRSISPALELDL
jgi:ferredoxin-NADP reductase